MSRLFGYAAVRVVWVAAALLLQVSSLSGQQADSIGQPGTTLRGTVRDSEGRAVADAHVILRKDSPPFVREEITDAAGQVTFAGVPPGEFSTMATLGPMKSARIVVHLSGAGEQQSVNFILGGPQTKTTQETGQTLQFADQPNFAIAGVTDWTAAGGHGSDSNLRTSEALTRQAVNLKPTETDRTAVSLPYGIAQGKESLDTLRASVARDPKGFEANSRLGQFYAQAGQYEEAIQPLQAAYQAEPANYENEQSLAQALEMAGHTSAARDHVRSLLARRESAELYRMEGKLDEKLGDSLSAVRAFQQAVKLDASEENYFAWGAELLTHRAVWQAKEVFDQGTKLYPQSVRMLTARGADLFAGALYEEAVSDLCKASDLEPGSVEPYLFIGKVEIASPHPLPCVVEKLARFEKLQPQNYLANYYYAMALKKQYGQRAAAADVAHVKDLLARAVALNPKCAEGYLELGNLSAGKKHWDQAISHYLQAIEADPDLDDAHYRLGVAYERTGDHEKAQEQFQLHDAIASRLAAEIQRQREAVKQFLVVSPDQASSHSAK